MALTAALQINIEFNLFICYIVYTEKRNDHFLIRFLNDKMLTTQQYKQGN